MKEFKTHGPNNMTNLLIELPLETRHRLAHQAEALGIPQIQIIRSGIHQFLDSLEAQEAERQAPKPRRGRRPKATGDGAA
jgi:hypothetical protein